MTQASAIEIAQKAVLRRFAWADGHADIWRIFDDARAFAAVVAGLVAPWESDEITKVCAVESRGFILGGAVACALDAGFVAIRKEGNLFPGAKQKVVAAAPDYRGTQHALQMQEQAIYAGDRCLLVDDWIEQGSQAAAACELITRGGGLAVGISVIVDQLTEERRRHLPRLTSIVTTADLPAV
jgi:adenine phosphoribosyltransferase